MVVAGGREVQRVMGRTYDALLRAEQRRGQHAPEPTASDARALEAPRSSGAFTIAIASPKGGVGKTTLALHLAVYLRALREDLPILVWNLDEQDTLDRGLLRGFSQVSGEAAFHRGLGAASQPGEYGIDLVAAPVSGQALESAIDSTGAIRRVLAVAERRGVVILDTGSRLGRAADAAVAAADLVLVPVGDLVSFREGGRVWEQVHRIGRPADVRAILFGVDLRVKLEGSEPDVLALLLKELARARRDHFPTFVSYSPSVAGLCCRPDGRLRTVLHAAPRSVVHRQMAALGGEILDVAESALAARDAAPVGAARSGAPAPVVAPRPVRAERAEAEPVPRAPRPGMAKVPASRPRSRGFFGDVLRRLTS